MHRFDSFLLQKRHVKFYPDSPNKILGFGCGPLIPTSFVFCGPIFQNIEKIVPFPQLCQLVVVL